MNSATAYIGLGSNVGDRAANLSDALRQVAALPGVALRRTASVYETAPMERTDQDWFLNTVAEIEITIVPRELLDRLRIIEEKLGRVRAERWGPRVIDLDILLYGNWEIEDPDLQIPHPRLADRAFVMVPLAELAPDLTLPGGMKAADLASLLIVKQQVNKTRTELML